jgi:hypothetical protein
MRNALLQELQKQCELYTLRFFYSTNTCGLCGFQRKTLVQPPERRLELGFFLSVDGPKVE